MKHYAMCLDPNTGAFLVDTTQVVDATKRYTF